MSKCNKRLYSGGKNECQREYVAVYYYYYASWKTTLRSPGGTSSFIIIQTYNAHTLTYFLLIISIYSILSTRPCIYCLLQTLLTLLYYVNNWGRIYMYSLWTQPKEVNTYLYSTCKNHVCTICKKSLLRAPFNLNSIYVTMTLLVSYMYNCIILST